MGSADATSLATVPSGYVTALGPFKPEGSPVEEKLSVWPVTFVTSSIAVPAAQLNMIRSPWRMVGWLAGTVKQAVESVSDEPSEAIVPPPATHGAALTGN